MVLCTTINDQMKNSFILLVCFLASNCATALPIASGIGNTVRSEIRVRELESRVTENEKIIEYLLELLDQNTNN
jgi:hypothetical protein